MPVSKRYHLHHLLQVDNHCNTHNSPFNNVKNNINFNKKTQTTEINTLFIQFLHQNWCSLCMQTVSV